MASALEHIYSKDGPDHRSYHRHLAPKNVMRHAPNEDIPRPRYVVPASATGTAMRP